MNIYELDEVRLRYSHEWFGRVMRIECDQALVLRPPLGEVAWMPLEFLELKAGQEEVLEA